MSAIGQVLASHVNFRISGAPSFNSIPNGIRRTFGRSPRPLPGDSPGLRQAGRRSRRKNLAHMRERRYPCGSLRLKCVFHPESMAALRPTTRSKLTGAMRRFGFAVKLQIPLGLSAAD